MKMHILSGGRLRMRRSVFFPGTPREETIEVPVSCGLIKHRQGNVLFDTGCPPEAAVDPAGRWGTLARAMAPIFEPRDTVIEQLATTGLTADDIDVVVCSHLHPDHCGCNAFFRKATVVAHAAEWEAARSETGLAQGYLPADWDHDNPTLEIDTPHDLFGDGRVTLLPMPGHTPGMLVAQVVLDRDGAFVLASDAAPLRANLEGRYAPRNTWNMDLAVAAIEEILRLEHDGAHIICGHDDEQWRSMRKGAEFYA